MAILTETFTVHLPAVAAYRLRRVAEISSRSIDDVIADTLCTALPPSLEEVPTIYRKQLTALENLPAEKLLAEIQATLPTRKLARYDTLLQAHAAGKLDEAGRKELAALRLEADRLMFRKAYAALLLRWRGVHLPTLEEFEAEG